MAKRSVAQGESSPRRRRSKPEMSPEPKEQDKIPPVCSENEIKEGSDMASGQVAEESCAGNAGEKDKKKSDSAKAFRELRDSVFCIDNKIEEVGRFIRVAKDKLIKDAEQHHLEAIVPVLQSVFRLHDIVFKRVTAMETGEREPDGFAMELLQLVEDMLVEHDVQVVRPQSGEAIDLKLMDLQRDVPARFWRRPDTVARVHACGFVLSVGGMQRVLRSCRVDVYRKSKQ